MQRFTVVAVWFAALVGAALIGIFADPPSQLAWVSVVMLLLVVLASILQLCTQEPSGFITRMALSLLGAVLILGVASFAFVLAGAGDVVG